jgi:hypothetical protein
MSAGHKGLGGRAPQLGCSEGPLYQGNARIEHPQFGHRSGNKTATASPASRRYDAPSDRG